MTRARPANLAGRRKSWTGERRQHPLLERHDRFGDQTIVGFAQHSLSVAVSAPPHSGRSQKRDCLDRQASLHLAVH